MTETQRQQSAEKSALLQLARARLVVQEAENKAGGRLYKGLPEPEYCRQRQAHWKAREAACQAAADKGAQRRQEKTAALKAEIARRSAA